MIIPSSTLVVPGIGTGKLATGLFRIEFPNSKIVNEPAVKFVAKAKIFPVESVINLIPQGFTMLLVEKLCSNVGLSGIFNKLDPK